jgi:hypothetical protein
MLSTTVKLDGDIGQRASGAGVLACGFRALQTVNMW